VTAILRAALPLWLAITAATLGAQQVPLTRASVPERPVLWSLAAEPEPESPGRLQLVLQAAVEEGWYVYALSQPPGGPQPLDIQLVEGSGFTIAGDIAAPRPRTYPDRVFNLLTAIYRGQSSFTIPVATESAPLRVESIGVAVQYQTCNARYCLPPRTDTVATALFPARPVAMQSDGGPLASQTTAAKLAAADAAQLDDGHLLAEDEASAAEFVTPFPPDGASADREALRVFGQAASTLPDGAAARFGFLWLAIGMGLLSLLTPCVFPMIPLTVSYFGSASRDSGGSRVRDASLFGAGILFTFVAVGFGVTVLFGAGSVIRLAASPWMNLAIAGLFLLFALNLLGLLELRLPTRLLDAVAAASRRGRSAGAVLMGGAFAITSFTCTAPFVGTLLVLATQGSWRWPLLGLAAYATAFALPFVLLALAPGSLARLPRSGPWIVDLRRALGVLEIALAVKFLANADLVWGWGLLGRDAVIVVAILAVLGVGLLVVWRRRATRPRLATSVACLLFAAWLSRGLQGYRLGELEALLPPAPHGVALAGPGELPWHVNDFEASLRRAQQQQRPLLVDFTGYTCTNCRWMEANMFPRREVRALLGEYVRLRLYTDGRGSIYEQQQQLQQEMFGTIALPYYAIISPSGQPVAAFLGMTRDEDEFARFLAAGLPNVNLQ
jgi:thiol:disulfide interchange protein